MERSVDQQRWPMTPAGNGGALFYPACSEFADVCDHAKQYFASSDGWRALNTVQRLVVTAHLHLGPVRPVFKCLACSRVGVSVNLHICLHCVFLGCGLPYPGKPGTLSCFAAHSLRTGHVLSCDLTHNQLFCAACGDYVYDAKFDRCAMLHQFFVDRNVQVINDMNVMMIDPPPNGRKVTLPSIEQTETIATSAIVADRKSSLIGIRGLNNLGSTCFMNTILQALSHGPSIVRSFLGGCHPPERCPRSRNGKICLLCEVGEIIEQVHAGNPTPFTPRTFLYHMWKSSQSLAGYEQQDAHEFLIWTFNEMHRNSQKSDSLIDDHCSCIVHRLFSGKLKSEITCMHCQNVSSTLDMFFDLSLDLSNETETGANSLARCLERFTQPERLEHSERFFCSKCGGLRDSVKQFSIHSLPTILICHVKRFKHSTNHVSQKLADHVDIPLFLNVAPFLSSSVRGVKPAVISEWAQSPKLRFRELSHRETYSKPDHSPVIYSLYAVVYHMGSLSSGHYVVFIRHTGRWFECDDACVRAAKEEQILQCQAYLLFYTSETAVA